MTLTIDVTEQAARLLTEQAKRNGKEVGAYLSDLAERAAQNELNAWEDTVGEAADLISPSIPPLSEFAVSREGIYERAR